MLMQLHKGFLADEQVLSDIVQKAALREGQHVALDLQISAYVDDAGASDRIQKTCIPQSYTRHTSRESLQVNMSDVYTHGQGHCKMLQSSHFKPGPLSLAVSHHNARPDTVFIGTLMIVLTFMLFIL